MSIRTALNTAIHFVNVNSPVILSGVAIIGVGATVYLTYRGTKSAEKKIQQNIFEHCQPGEDGNGEDPDFYDPDLRTKIRLTWKDYIPPILAGGLTIGCIVGAQYINAKKLAYAASVIGVYQTMDEKQKQRIKDFLPEGEYKKFLEKEDKDIVSSRPVPDDLIVDGQNDICYDKITGRYFSSTKNRIHEMINEANASILRNGPMTYNDMGTYLGLPDIKIGEEFGWTEDRLIQPKFSAVQLDDGRYVTVLDYVHDPKPLTPRYI